MTPNPSKVSCSARKVLVLPTSRKQTGFSLLEESGTTFILHHHHLYLLQSTNHSGQLEQPVREYKHSLAGSWFSMFPHCSLRFSTVPHGSPCFPTVPCGSHLVVPTNLITFN